MNGLDSVCSEAQIKCGAKAGFVLYEQRFRRDCEAFKFPTKLSEEFMVVCVAGKSGKLQLLSFYPRATSTLDMRQAVERMQQFLPHATSWLQINFTLFTHLAYVGKENVSQTLLTIP